MSTKIFTTTQRWAAGEGPCGYGALRTLRRPEPGPSMKPLLIGHREAPDALSDGQAPQPPPAEGAIR